jgi:hypothetical protein
MSLSVTSGVNDGFEVMKMSCAVVELGSLPGPSERCKHFQRCKSKGCRKGHKYDSSGTQTGALK